DHVVEPRALQRCEKVMDVRTGLLLAHLLQRPEGAAPFAFDRKLRTPLAIPAVEDEYLGACPQAQDVTQIVRLLARAWDLDACAVLGFDEETLGGEIVNGHDA